MVKNQTLIADTVDYFEGKEKVSFGFSAQELEQVFPELVEMDNDGYLTVDYISLIPVLVEAIKELNVELESLKAKSNSKNAKGATIYNNESNTDILSERAILYQNSPNPFSQTTIIKYFLPEVAENAMIYIYNMNGIQIKSLALQNKGEGNVTLTGSDLTAGMYMYSFVVDGVEIDTKRMILTQ
jgi:hypothetical protein